MLVNRLIFGCLLLSILLYNNVLAIDTTLYKQAVDLLSEREVRDTITFAVLSDSHYNEEVGYSEEFIFNKILGSIKLQNPDFMIICGDAYQDCGWIEEFYKRMKNDSVDGEDPGWMYETKIPVFIVPGNHDFQNSNCWNLYRELINPNWGGGIIYGQPDADTAFDYSFDYGNENSISRFFSTRNVYHPKDTYVTDSTYHLTQIQLDTLGSRLSDENLPDNIFCFVHDPWLISRDTIYKYKYRDTLKKYNVKANFSGHMHKYFRYSEPGFLDITNGPAGGGIAQNPFENPPNEYQYRNFLMVTVIGKEGDDDITVEVFDEDGTKLTDYTFKIPLERTYSDEPEQRKFDLGGVEKVFVSADSANFQTDEMIIGWHIKGDKLITSAMNMNMYNDTSAIINSSDIPDNMLIIRGTEGVWSSNPEIAAAMSSMAIQYEPTLILHPDSLGQFKTSPNDPVDPVFGFREIDTNITMTDSTIIIDTTILDSLFLCKLWPYTTEESIHKLSYTNPLINGTEFYLDIKIKRHDSTDNVFNDSRVLGIVARYNGDSGEEYIEFSKLPRGGISRIDEIYTPYNEYRGKVRRLDSLETPRGLFEISQNMIPAACEPVIISGYFKCDTIVNDYFDKSSEHTIDIKLYYSGNCAIEIDWIRLSTPNARKLLFGEYDKTIVENIQKDLDSLANSANGLKAYRFFNGADLNPAYWQACRYFNKLVGNVGISKDKGDYDPLFRHYVGAAERWIDFGSPGRKTAMPFLFNVEPDPEFCTSLGLGPGFNGINPADSMASGYETFIRNGSNMAYLDTTSDYDSYLNLIYSSDAISSFQGYMESMLYEYFMRNKNFLYSDKDWWGQLSIGADWGRYYDVIGETHLRSGDYNRPKTAEEIRALAMGNIIKGAKGLVFNRDMADGTFNDTSCSEIKTGIVAYDKQTSIDGLSDDQIVYGDSAGLDNIIVDDPNGLDQYLSLDTIARHMRVSNDDIYIGQKSTRCELKHIIDWVEASNSVLTRLQLLSWYGKGFKKLRSTHPNYDFNVLDSLIVLDSIKTRPIGRTHEVAGDIVPWFENETVINGSKIDSAFYDISLLINNYNPYVDTFRTPEPVFYIGVQNRRTDPLILQYDGVSSDYMQFLPSAKFDQLVNGPDSSYWRGRWWDRQGCREIRIPFNVQSTVHHSYFWLHVTEVGSENDSLSSQWWRGEKYHHTIDTVIARDSVLIVKLLPGEGKILKVAISYSNIDVDGFLEYSNQRKIVAYPFKQDSIHHFGNTDTVRYHMVYTRPTIAGDSSYDMSKMRVWYKRSHPVSKDFYSYQIEWEQEEYCLSDSVYCNYLYGPYEKYIDATLDCRNPSIVVRFDEESGEAKAYVVYACADLSEDYDRLFLVENVLSANDTTKPVDERYPYGLEVTKYKAQDIEKWGTPVINASVNGNYYAWPDSVFGITVGWKTPDDDYFAGPDHMKFIHWNPLPTIEATHPSLNTYSRVRLGEDDCALVWQEKVDSPTKPQIYYTRLRMKDGALEYYLSEYFNNTSVCPVNIDTTIAHLSYPADIDRHTYKDFEYPILYRGVEDGTFTSPQDTLNLLISHWDRVYWQGTGDAEETDRLYLTTIDIRDTIMADNSIEPAGWALQNPYMIWSETENLNYPNAAQGCIRYEDTLWVGSANQGDSVVVLNFIAYPEDSTASVNSQIWSLYHSYWGLYNNGMGQFGNYDTVYNEYRYSQPISARGNHPHLAAMPYMKDRSDWRFNRRIFESGNDTVPNLVSSFQYFMKKRFNPKKAYPFFGFSGNGIKSMLSPVWTIDSHGKPRPLRIYAGKRERGMIKRSDTVNSAWFKIRNIKDIHFLGYGGKAKKLKMYIERKSDGRKFKVPLAEDKEDKFLLHKFKLINAANQEYRIIWNKLDPDLRFREELVVGGLPDIVDLMGDVDNNNFPKLSEEINQGVIDLGGKSLNDMDRNLSLSVYPNPADQLIYITPYLKTNDESDGKINLSIYSSLGHLIHSQDVITGETVQIPTGQLPVGVYFVKAETNSMSTDNPVKPIIETVVIQR